MKTPLVLSLVLTLGAGLVVAAEGDKKPAAPAIPAAPAAPAAPGAPTPPPAATPKLPEALQKYDKNGDGKLDEEERRGFQKERQAEMMKKYDKNGDGKLDETERQGLIEDRKKERDEMIRKRQGEIKQAPAAPAAPQKPAAPAK